MKLKYYLRGLGIGVVVTALIMGIATDSSKETLSNEQIKERAEALGMIDGSAVLQETLPTAKPTAKPTVKPTAEPTTEPTAKPTAEPTAEPTTEPTAKPTAEPTAEPTAKPTATPTAKPTQKPTSKPVVNVQEGETIVIVVKSGEGSYAVCEKLEAAGVIASASDFDSFLGQNGYDRRIRAGEHEIPIDAEPREIAEILAGILAGNS